MSIILYITGLICIGFFSAKFPYWIIWTALGLAYVCAPTWLYFVLGVPALVFLLPMLRQQKAEKVGQQQGNKVRHRPVLALLAPVLQVPPQS